LPAELRRTPARGSSGGRPAARTAHLAPENLKAAVGVLDRLRSGYVDRADAVVALKVSA